MRHHAARASVKSFLIGLLLAASLPCAMPAAAVPSISVADAMAMCEAGFPPPGGNAASASRRAACIAYMEGVIAAVMQIAAMAAPGADGRPAQAIFCVPPSESHQWLSDGFLRFARTNPKLMDRPAASLFLAAFAARYPCK